MRKVRRRMPRDSNSIQSLLDTLGTGTSWFAKRHGPPAIPGGKSFTCPETLR